MQLACELQGVCFHRQRYIEPVMRDTSNLMRVYSHARVTVPLPK